ncbi:hypothetical protein Gotur_023943 [Gossypium turneri]
MNMEEGMWQLDDIEGEITDEDAKAINVCEEDNPSPPLSRSLCNQPECEHHCALRHPKTKAWGKCKFNDDRFVCDCCYLCDHHSLEAPSYNARKLSYAPSY